MSEEPTEFDKAEFDSIARELREDTYATIGKSITAWSATESILVTIATMLLDTRPEKAGLVLYSINNFHTWLSIIEELFAIDQQFTLLRPEWIAISNRLRKLNDTRVSLAHHALGPGKGLSISSRPTMTTFPEYFRPSGLIALTRGRSLKSTRQLDWNNSQSSCMSWQRRKE